MFFLELEISGVGVQRLDNRAKNDGFCEGLLSENNFETILATSCCYEYANASEVVFAIFYISDYGANASEAV